MTGRISRNLDILEKSVNECGKTAIEDAAIAGKDLDSMNNEELNRFRGLTGKYKNECICMKTLTREQAERKGKEISESIQKLTKVATEKGKEKYEEISARARPKYEELKEKAGPKIEEIKGKATTKIGEISTKAEQIIREMREKYKAEKSTTS